PGARKHRSNRFAPAIFFSPMLDRFPAELLDALLCLCERRELCRLRAVSRALLVPCSGSRLWAGPLSPAAPRRPSRLWPGPLLLGLLDSGRQLGATHRGLPSRRAQDPSGARSVANDLNPPSVVD